MKNSFSSAVLLLLLPAFFLSACTSSSTEQKADALPYLKIEGTAFGTTYSISYADSAARNLKTAIDSVLLVFDQSLSTYNPQSLISRINRGEEHTTDHYFETVFQRSNEICAATDGAFDPTVAPLVNAWGFGFSNQEQITEARVRELLTHTGYRRVRIENKKVVKEDSLLMFDFNAIAKGYGVDVVGHYLASQGITHYLVEIGGEIVAQGQNSKGKAWSIGIDKPVDNASPGAELQAIVHFTGKGLATSGNYRRFYEKDGIKYAHTLDPKTGYPVQHSLLSATVIAHDCMTADAYATAFMVLGLEKSKVLLAKHPELEVFLVFSDANGQFQVWETEGMKQLVTDVQ